MEPFVRRFIKASLTWLGIGVILGLIMTLWPYPGIVYRAAHAHANLLGFVSMMIFGVAYHVLPRFVGRPLHSRMLPALHLWLANLGLAGMMLGWLAPALPAASAGIGLGGILVGVGAFLFIYNIWRTLGAGLPEPVRIDMGRSPGAAAAAAGRIPVHGP